MVISNVKSTKVGYLYIFYGVVSISLFTIYVEFMV